MGLIKTARSILKYGIIFSYGFHLGGKCTADVYKENNENIQNKISNEQQYNNLESKVK